ncbi:unnamed protein product [Brassica oleracea]
MAVYVEKKHWWLRNKKIVDKYVKEAKNLIASQDPNDVESALNLLDSALSVSPRYELALELKARSLLYLRRFKDVADMLHDYIPSLKFSGEDSGIGSSESSRELVSLLNELPSHGGESGDSSFKCFSVSDLKKKVMAGLSKNCNEQGQWRYLVLGQACCHLGLMEDAMVLLQTGKRLATAALRRQSISLSDDSFILFSSADGASSPPSSARYLTESDHVLAHIKLLLRRRTRRSRRRTLLRINPPFLQNPRQPPRRAAGLPRRVLHAPRLGVQIRRENRRVRRRLQQDLSVGSVVPPSVGDQSGLARVRAVLPRLASRFGALEASLQLDFT